MCKYLLCLSLALLSVQDQAFYSQAAQDEFVHTLCYKLTNKQDTGYYLELGAWHPISINNTYALEQKHNWRGLSIDISSQFDTLWKQQRKNPLHVVDATKADYKTLLKTYPKTIDYLSLDINNQYVQALNKIPFDEYTFKIITIEHDQYRHGPRIRAQERKFLHAQGYYLLCPDIQCRRGSFEDWWIHPSAFPKLLPRLQTLDLKAKHPRAVLDALSTL